MELSTQSWSSRNSLRTHKHQEIIQSEHGSWADSQDMKHGAYGWSWRTLSTWTENHTLFKDTSFLTFDNTYNSKEYTRPKRNP